MLKQKYTSADTCVNTKTKVYSLMKFKKNAIVLDYGGGKYDTNTIFIKSKNVEVYVYDPYNRSEEHNETVLDNIRNNNGADYVVCANVVNVIMEDEVIIYILQQLKKCVKKDGIIYIQIYEGDKTGIGKETSKGYQKNMKTVDYLNLIAQEFGDDYIISKKNNIFSITRKEEEK